MGMLGFDNQYAMFDVTPVSNQFILEHMPAAKAEYVKVYLYGLTLCYNPVEDMSTVQMANLLNISEEEVLAAYRYWERAGLVRRISDKPMQYRYVHVSQQLFAGDQTVYDNAYVDFHESMKSLFSSRRKLRDTDISLAYEWVEQLKLPTEVVLMLMEHMIAIRGINFTIKLAEPLAIELAEQQVQTIEDAENVLSREREVWEGSRAIVRRLGSRRDPTEDEQRMYRRWLRDWGCTPDAIEAACAETTKTNRPSFAYLEGVLKGMMDRQGTALTSGRQVEQQRSGEKAEIEPLKRLLAAMNIGLTVNDETRKKYRELRQLYPDDVILMAGNACAGRRDADLETVQSMLASWKKKGLNTVDEVQAYLDDFRKTNQYILGLFIEWGYEGKPTGADRDRLHAWQDKRGLSLDTIGQYAVFAKDAKTPMQYLDKLIEEFARQGITTMEQAEKANEAWRQSHQGMLRKGGKVVHEQQYEQREYTNDDDELKRQIAEWKGAMNADAQ